MSTGVVVLDEKDCIRRFSQLIDRDFLLQDHDIGRSMATVGPRLEFTDLLELTEALRSDPSPQIRKGIHDGRGLTVQALRTFLGPAGERVQGTIILFRWD